MIEIDRVELCTEAFGASGDPPILLVGGMSGSMLWWDERFCRMLADGGRFVIRYDHRDTGRSVTYEPGRPGYTAADLVDDGARVLDAYGLRAAHIVGVSMGGALAQVLVLDHPDRVLSLALISTSPALPGARELPAPAERFSRFTAEVDWRDEASVVEYLVAYSRMLAGQERAFDDAALRELAGREVRRARDPAAASNHELLEEGDRSRPPLATISVPTLVLHGTDDPLFPLAHGESLANAIPGASLVTLDGAGHGLERDDWGTVARAILAHTTAPAPG